MCQQVGGSVNDHNVDIYLFNSVATSQNSASQLTPPTAAPKQVFRSQI